MGVDVSRSPFTLLRSLSNKMVGNTLALLLQSRVRDAGVGQDGLVVTKDVCGSLAWDSHHSQLVPQPSEILAAVLHCTEFVTKAA